MRAAAAAAKASMAAYGHSPSPEPSPQLIKSESHSDDEYEGVDNEQSDEYERDGDVKDEPIDSPSPTGVKRELDDDDYDTTPAKRSRLTKAAPTKKGRKLKQTPTSNRVGKKWTGAELEALHRAALGGSVSQSRFNGAVPGRTPNQCSMTWRYVLTRAALTVVTPSIPRLPSSSRSVGGMVVGRRAGTMTCVRRLQRSVSVA